LAPHQRLLALSIDDPTACPALQNEKQEVRLSGQLWSVKGGADVFGFFHILIFHHLV
jgi:hypothetical protein